VDPVVKDEALSEAFMVEDATFVTDTKAEFEKDGRAEYVLRNDAKEVGENWGVSD